MIKSLQGLRTLATIGIFLFHSGLLLKGTFPVTFFFILSGFVIYYSSYKKVISFNVFKSILDGVNRIKKLYPVHLITFFLSLIIRFDWVIKNNFWMLIRRIILNLLLIQTFIPKYSLGFNGVSWFLSTLTICYICSNILIYFIKFMDNHNFNFKFLIILTWCIQIIIFFIISNFINDFGWFFYFSPYFRLTDFFLGMVLAKVFIEDNNKEIKDNKANKQNTYNLIESVIVLVFIIMYILSFKLNEAFPIGIYYCPLFLLLIYVFSKEKGYISRLLKKDVFQKFAAISFQFYMVHELILILFRKIFINIEIYWIIKNIIIAIPAFMISVCVAKLTKLILLKYKREISIVK